MVAPTRIAAGNPSLGELELEAVTRVMRSGRLTQGPEVAAFEREFAERLGVPYALAVGNGTEALHLALAALGLGPGDEVIVPATTFIATVNAVAYVGATPVIADVEPDTWCLSVSDTARRITRRTKAILPAHIFGAMADMDALAVLACSHGLLLVEDAAEALGATWNSRASGTLGVAGTFSFYGNKTITTGEGGMVATADANLLERMFRLRGQGMVPGSRYWHDRLGYNYRMTELQAAIGRAQLSQLDGFVLRREAVAARYLALLGQRLVFQSHGTRCRSGYWAVAVKLPVEDATPVANGLARAGIETRPVFPPAHWMPMYHTGDHLPVAEELFHSGLVLPTHARLTEQDVDDVATALLAELDSP